MLWLLLLRKGNLSHSTDIDQLGGLQPVRLSLGSGLSHLTVGNIYLTGSKCAYECKSPSSPHFRCPALGPGMQLDSRNTGGGPHFASMSLALGRRSLDPTTQGGGFELGTECLYCGSSKLSFSSRT